MSLLRLLQVWLFVLWRVKGFDLNWCSGFGPFQFPPTPCGLCKERVNSTRPFMVLPHIAMPSSPRKKNVRPLHLRNVAVYK
jgi:hypothetical protein